VLKAYEGKNIPLEYAKVEAEMKAKHVAEWNAKHKSVGSGFSFGSAFGFSNVSLLSTMTPSSVFSGSYYQTPTLPKNQAPPTYLESKRQEAQQHYKDEMKHINNNKEELERLLAQDQQMMNAQVPGTLLEAVDQILGKAPPPAAPGAPGAVGTTATPPGAASSSQASPPASSVKA